MALLRDLDKRANAAANEIHYVGKFSAYSYAADELRALIAELEESKA